VRKLAWLVGLVLTAVVAGLTHLVAAVWFVFGICGVSDTAVTFPAPASPQGLLCDAGHDDSRWELVALVALAVSAVLAVALVALLWHRLGGWLRPLSVVPLLAMPLLTLVLLALPPDTCSGEARRAHPAYDCRTTPDG
jgi:hypothetical protein